MPTDQAPPWRAALAQPSRAPPPPPGTMLRAFQPPPPPPPPFPPAGDEPEAEDEEEEDEEDEDARLMGDATPRAFVGAYPRAAPFLPADAAFPVKKEELSGPATTSATAATLSVSTTSGKAGAAPRPQVVPHVIRRRNVGVPKFLRFLYQILDVEDPDVITWAHAGTAFQIRRPDALAEAILPRYFKHNKVSSFQRQLNYFGFKKWTKTQTNVCTFSHPFFLRDDKDKMKLIKRKERANVHAIGPFAAFVMPPASSRASSAFSTSTAMTSTATSSGLAASAVALPKPTPVKRQKSSSAALSPREVRPPVSFLGSAAAGRRYSTGALPGADGMLGMSVESLFFQTGPAGSLSTTVGMAPPSFMAANLSTAATRKRAAEAGELETNPFQQTGFFFGGGTGSFNVDMARDFGPAARMSQGSRTRSKRKSLPTVLPPSMASAIPANSFGLQQQQQQRQQQQQHQQQQLFLNKQAQQRRKSEQFAPTDFVATMVAQQQRQQQANKAASTSVGNVGTFVPYGSQQQTQDPSSLSMSSAALMQTAFQLHNQNPHRQSNIFAPGYAANANANAQYQSNTGAAGAGGMMSMAFKFGGAGVSSPESSSSGAVIGTAPPSAFTNITMLDYNAHDQQSASGFARLQDSGRDLFQLQQQQQQQQQSVFQPRDMSADSANGVPDNASLDQQGQEQQPRDYIDVLLESAALEEGMGSAQVSPTTAGEWGEPSFAPSSNAMAPFGMAASPQQPHHQLLHRPPHAL